MKSTSILTLTLLICLHASGQRLEPEIKWGKEFDAPKRSSLNDIIGYDGTGIYAIKERYVFGGPVKYTLEHYDQNFIPIRSFDLDLKEDGRECFVEKVLQLNSRLYLFSYFPNSKSKKNILYVQEIDKRTLKPDDKKLKIAEIDFTGESRYNSGDFQVRVSRDSSKLLISYMLPYEKYEPEGFGLHVLDDQLQPLWNKEIKLPYENQLFDIESFKVSNDGDVYLLGLIYNDRRISKRKGAANYKYQVFAYMDNGETLKEYPVSLPDKFLTDMQIEVLGNKNLICAGFYSEKGTYSIRGTYFLTIDGTTKEIKTTSFKDFGIDFITQNMTEGEANRTKRREERGNENELYEYDLDKLIVGRDGGAMLFGEQYFIQRVTYQRRMAGMSGASSMMQTYTTTHYYYNDIIAVKIDPSGQIEWAEKIAKRQHTTEDGGFYSSYTMAIIKGQICFIFNDNPKNITYNGSGRVFNYHGGHEAIVTMVSLDPSGKQIRQPLFNSGDMEVIVRPKVCEQITSRDIILFGQRRKTQQFARISF
jgi:hypothetical protein